MSKNKEEKTTATTPEEQVLGYLNSCKDDHFNFQESSYYQVSSGSLILDSVLKGGFQNGLIRLIGQSTGGKTSEAFEIAKNFMETVPNSRSIYIKAEGRLSKNLMQRSSLKFIEGKPDGWVNGTIWVFECNIYETILGLISSLVMDNPNKVKYCIILDSVDGVILKNDMTKTLAESVKIAGASVIIKKFFQQTGMFLFKGGHLPIFTSQVSANISLTPNAAANYRMIESSGGNSLIHVADYIISFSPQFQGDLILENPNAKFDRINNKVVGHWCKIEIKKSNEETKGQRLSYPIKHGRGIWRELEIVDFLLGNQLLIKSGAWFNFEDSILIKLKELQPNTKEKFQGLQSIYDYLEENQPVTQYLYQLGREYLSAAGLPENVEID